MSLPASLLSMEPEPARPAPAVPAGPATVRGATVLVVDEDPDFVSLLGTLLKQAGFNVITAEGPNSARASLAKRPDAMIIDVNLGRWDGLELVRTIRLRSDVPIVLLGNAEQAAVQTAMGMVGANAYLKKPISQRELVECVSQLVAQGRSRTVKS
jgi:DNA-binding response OmpR family regulator